MVFESGRIQTPIAEPEVHRGDAGRPGIGEPGDLGRRGFACKYPRPPIGHVHGEVHENVDTIRPYYVTERLIVQLAHIAPYIGVTGDQARVVVRPLNTRVAEDLKRSMIVM